MIDRISNIMTIKVFILLSLSLATSALKCTPADFVDPATLSSKAPVCQGNKDGAYTDRAQAATGDFDPTAVDGGVDRGGKDFFESLLGGKNPDYTTYLQAVGMVAAPAVLFLVVNMCCCFCCSCCRCCICTSLCNTSYCCRQIKCIPTKTQDAYTNVEQILPMFMWLLFSILMFSFAIAGIVQGVYKLNDSAVNSVCFIDNSYLRFNGFLDNVKAPLTKLKVDFQSSVNDLSDAAVQDPQLSQNVLDIGTKFQDLGTSAQNSKDNLLGSLTPQEKEICEGAWDTLISASNEAKASAVASGKEIDKALTDVQTAIQTSIIDASSGATSALQTGFDTISTTQEQVGSLLNPRTYGLLDYAMVIQQNRDNGAFGFYGWVPIALMFGFVAIAGTKMFNHVIENEDHEDYYKKGGAKDRIQRTNPEMDDQFPLHQLTCIGKCCSCFGFCSWWLTLFFGIFCALFAIIFLPVGAAGSDACLVVPTLPQKLGELANSKQIDQITNTCWNKTGNLFVGLELDKSIDVDSINFDDFNEQFSGNSVNIDKDSLADLKSKIDEIPNNCFNPTTKPDTKGLVDLIENQITFAENAFNTNPSVGKLQDAGEKLINTIKCSIKDFIKTTSCYFIAQTWKEAVDVLCVGFIGSITWIGASELFLAVMAVPYAITMLCIMKRRGSHGPTKADSKHDDEEITTVNAKEVEMMDGYDD